MITNTVVGFLMTAIEKYAPKPYSNFKAPILLQAELTKP